MSLLEKLLSEQAPQLVSTLTEKGELSREEAERLVPAGTEATVSALQESEGLDLGNLLAGGNLSMLLEKIDLAALARRVGIGESKVSNGLQSLVPAVLNLIQSKGGSAESVQALLGGEGAKGLMSKAGQLAGKLFGK